MTDKTPLYHYTCKHGHDAIEHDGGMLKPSAVLMPLVPEADPLLWLTDLEWPYREAIGLTMNHLNCDRTEYRYRVDDTEHITRWLEFRGKMSEEYIWPLELAPGVIPGNWYVTTEPTKAVYDPTTQPRRMTT